MKIYHAGIAVNNIKETAERLSFLADLSEIYEDQIQNVKIAFIIDKDTNTLMIELIEPIDDNSPVINIINRDISNICYSVKNLDETI